MTDRIISHESHRTSPHAIARGRRVGIIALLMVAHACMGYLTVKLLVVNRLDSIGLDSPWPI